MRGKEQASDALSDRLQAWAADYYNRSTEYASRLNSKWQPGWLAIFAPYVELVQRLAGPGGMVLDIACGGGQSTYLISSQVGKVVGADLSIQALLKDRPVQPANVSFIQADGGSLPFAPGTFDVIASYATLEHVPDADRVLGEMVGLLKPGGWLVVFAPNMLSPLRVARLMLTGLRTGRWHPDGQPRFLVDVLRLNLLKVVGLQQDFVYRQPLVNDLSFPGSDYDAVCLVTPLDLLRQAERRSLRVVGIATGTSCLGRIVARWFPWLAGGIGLVAQKTMRSGE